jgi:hypothetical protein
MTDDEFENFLRHAARDYNEPPATPSDAMWARIEAARREKGSSAPLHAASPRRWLMLGSAIAAMLLVGIAIGYVWRGTTDSRLVAERPGGGADSAQPLRVAAESGQPGTPDSGTSSRESAPRTPGEQRLAALPPGTRVDARDLSGSARRPVPDAAGVSAGNQSAAYATLTAEHLGRVEMLLTSYRAESERGEVDPQITSWAGDLLGTTRLLLDSPGASDARMRKLLGDLEIVLTQITQLGAEQGTKKDELQLIDQSLRSHDVMTRIRGVTPAGAGALPIGT